jgi:hypothetical protein
MAKPVKVTREDFDEKVLTHQLDVALAQVA